MSATKGKEEFTMITIIKHNARRIEKVTVKELSYRIQFTTMGNNKQVDKFEVINDNLPNCAAHAKILYPEEMLAIYEYIKKVVKVVEVNP